MPVEAKELWSLALEHLQVDPDDLVGAIEDLVRRGEPDYRSRLLIRDSLDALQQHRGPERLRRGLLQCPHREPIEAIWTAQYDEGRCAAWRDKTSGRTGKSCRLPANAFVHARLTFPFPSHGHDDLRG